MSTIDTTFHDELELLSNEIAGIINCNDLANQFDLSAIDQREIERHLGINSDTYFNRLESDDMLPTEVDSILKNEFTTIMTIRYQDDQVLLKKHDDRVFLLVNSNGKISELLFINHS